MSERRHVTYLRSIYAFIRKPKVKFLLHPIPIILEHGFCITSANPNDDILICLDPRKEFIPTLIHECLHGLYPKYKEHKVKSLEKLIINKMTQKNYIDLLKCFSKNAKLYKLSGLSIRDIM